MISSFPVSRFWRRLYFAAVVSAAGNQLTRIVLFARVEQLGGAIEELTTVALAQALPALVVAPIAGTLSQRRGKRDFLVVSDVARCLLLLGIAATDSLSALVVMAALVGAFSAVFDPIEAALEPELLPQHEVQPANVFRTGALQILAIVGPAIAAGLLLVLSASAALVIDATSYLVSGFIIVGLPKRGGLGSTANGRPWTMDFREGAKFVALAPELRSLFAASSVVFLLLGMQGPLFFAFAAERLGSAGEAFGILMAALGLGSLIGVYLLAKRAAILGAPLNALCAILAIDAIALLAFTFGHTLLTCSLWMALMGLISSFFTVIVRTYLQTTPPPHMRSRVLGWFWAMYGPLVVLSLAIATWLARTHGPIVILRGAAGAELCAAALLTVSIRWRAKRERSVGAFGR